MGNEFSSPGPIYAYKLFSREKGKILEVGCGDLGYNFNVVTDGDYFVGLDISDEAIKKAKKNIRHRKKPSDFIVASATDLPFKDNSFDLVSSIETLTLMGEDFYKALKEMKRVSKDKLIFTLSHVDIAKAYNPGKEHEFVNKGNYFLVNSSKSGDKVFFTKANIETLLEKLELRIETLDVLKNFDVIALADYWAANYCEFPHVDSRFFIEARKK
ncbi:MAG: class I SAM-dependent methyltransferase [Nanoarchaeota archaeon]